MWRGKEFLNSQLFVEPFDLSVVKLSVIIGGQGPGDAKLEADVILDKFEGICPFCDGHPNLFDISHDFKMYSSVKRTPSSGMICS